LLALRFFPSNFWGMGAKNKSPSRKLINHAFVGET
jgi:hypothetical protein